MDATKIDRDPGNQSGGSTALDFDLPNIWDTASDRQTMKIYMGDQRPDDFENSIFMHSSSLTFLLLRP